MAWNASAQVIRQDAWERSEPSRPALNLAKKSAANSVLDSADRACGDRLSTSSRACMDKLVVDLFTSITRAVNTAGKQMCNLRKCTTSPLQGTAPLESFSGACHVTHGIAGHRRHAAPVTGRGGVACMPISAA